MKNICIAAFMLLSSYVFSQLPSYVVYDEALNKGLAYNSISEIPDTVSTAKVKTLAYKGIIDIISDGVVNSESILESTGVQDLNWLNRDIGLYEGSWSISDARLESTFCEAKVITGAVFICDCRITSDGPLVTVFDFSGSAVSLSNNKIYVEINSY